MSNPLTPPKVPKESHPLALLPLLLFLTLFVGSGLYFSVQGHENAFYQIAAHVAILPAIILGLVIAKGTFDQRITDFLTGVRDQNIVLMCLIYLLAGAFASVTQGIGSIEATVNFGLSFIPATFLLPGIFLIAATMATAMGTSMGVIATVGPLALGISKQAGLDTTWCMGAVVSGAMFGDNLSLISDTTIASVTTQGAKFKEKFFLNAAFALPAMLITIALFYLYSPSAQHFTVQDYDAFKIIPYLLILILALTGMNVFLVLTIGILSAGIIGLIDLPTYSLVDLSKQIADGFASMQEILILSLLIGGLSYLTNKQGGLNFLIHGIEALALKIRKKEKSGRIGELSIAAIATLADTCTANNTVAIILSGDIAKKLALKHGVSPERSACLLDIFSCVFQGLLPYSAQILLASSIAAISPIGLLVHVLYCPVLGVVTILGIVLKWPRHSIGRHRA